MARIVVTSPGRTAQITTMIPAPSRTLRNESRKRAVPVLNAPSGDRRCSHTDGGEIVKKPNSARSPTASAIQAGDSVRVGGACAILELSGMGGFGKPGRPATSQHDQDTMPSGSSSTSRRRNALLLALAYGGALLVVAAGFIAWRVVVHHRTFSGRSFFWLGDLHMNDDAIGFCMRPDRQGIAVLHHGVEDAARRIPVRTDAFGLRVPMTNTGTTTPPGGIAAVGCSCTFGHGVAAESTYVVLAGELLHLSSSNLGVCSYSGVSSLLLLEKHIARLRPSVVVYGCGNFHRERAARPRGDGVLWQAYATAVGDDVRIVPPAFSNRRAFDVGPRVEALYYEPRLAGQTTPFTPTRIAALLPLAVEEFGRAVQPSMLRLRRAPAPLPEAAFHRFLLERMHAVCAAHGARFVLLFFPAFLHEEPAPGLAAAASALSKHQDFTFVDCGPRLFADCADQAAYSARWQVPRDGHPNRFMHLEMARAVAAALPPSHAP